MKQSGIYALWYEEQDLIYIGQSIDIPRRYKEHIGSLAKGMHSNYKVQDAFNNYGSPELVVLEQTTGDLNSLEVQWTSEFNSLQSLNIVEAGSVGHGTNSNHSIYTKIQILRAFRLLYSTSMKYSDISKITGVKLSTLKAIVAKNKHNWLLDKYPHLFSKIRGKRDDNRGLDYSCRSGTLLVFVSPEGREYNVYNVGQFAKQYNLHQPTLMYLVKGARKHHKGWKFLKAVADITLTSSIGETKIV